MPELLLRTSALGVSGIVTRSFVLREHSNDFQLHNTYLIEICSLTDAQDCPSCRSCILNRRKEYEIVSAAHGISAIERSVVRAFFHLRIARSNQSRCQFKLASRYKFKLFERFVLCLESRLVSAYRVQENMAQNPKDVKKLSWPTKPSASAFIKAREFEYITIEDVAALSVSRKSKKIRGRKNKVHPRSKRPLSVMLGKTSKKPTAF